MTLKWFLSGTVRDATAMWKHVEKLLNHQRDVLSPQAISAVEEAQAGLKASLAAGGDKAVLEKGMENLEKTAGKWLKPYPNASARENVEVLLVALAVAMGIRTFFLQPFKIPTGSMQPTLFGVTSQNLLETEGFKPPTGWARVREWFEGVSYVNLKAQTEGSVERVEPPVRLLIFNIKQTLWIGGRPHTMWFPPDFGGTPLEYRAGLRRDRVYKPGEQVIYLRVAAGDHLFVDRMTYNFRRPTRGEIIVFETKGIDRLPQDQFYIKRLVALGGEKVQIGDDRHLIIDGKRLDASTPHFEKVYSFDPNKPPADSQYSGHVNERVAAPFHAPGQELAPYFPDADAVFAVTPDHYLVMGDNTMNSFDSRGWGEFPASNVIGKSFFVYWPLTDRFGWGYHR